MNKTIKIDKKVKMCYNTIGEIKKTLQQDKGDDTMKWTSIPTDEKETILNFDYFDNKVNLYTTNQPTGNRLKKIGEPTKRLILKEDCFSDGQFHSKKETNFENILNQSL